MTDGHPAALGTRIRTFHMSTAVIVFGDSDRFNRANDAHRVGIGVQNQRVSAVLQGSVTWAVEKTTTRYGACPHSGIPRSCCSIVGTPPG